MTINEVHLEYLGTLSYNVLLSLIVSALMYFLTYWVIHGIRKSSTSNNTAVRKIDPTLLPITVTIIKYAAVIFNILIILNIFGANTNGIIAFLGTAGLGIALALKDTLQNIASGIMLIFLRPFKVNDSIECGQNIGTVQEINLFTTTLKTADGLFLFVPNNLLWNSAIKNYTRNGTRRLDFIIGIAYKDQIEQARSILNKLADLDGRILKDPSPIVVVNSLADNSVNLMLRCWIPVDSYWDVNFYLQKTVKEQFDDAGISIPFPQRDIHLHIINEKNGSDNSINTIKALT